MSTAILRPASIADSTSAVPGPAEMAPRTRMILTGPLVPTLLRLAAPNIAVTMVMAAMTAVDAFYLGWLGSDALAGVALVFPAMMLMTAMSAAAVGGGIASAIARALGRRQPDEADGLATHALVISAAFAAIFTIGSWAGGPALYTAMGGSGATLNAAIEYSNVVFGGAAAIWLLNALASTLRGSGQMLVPSAVMILGEVLHAALAPLLIFGWGPVPALGVSGAGISLVATVVLRAVILVGYMASGRSLVTPRLRGVRLNRTASWEILRVGLPGSINTVLTNGYIVMVTGLVGPFGTAALAGYGLGARLEYFMIPLIFGFGSALVPMVGTNIGAGQVERARRVAWVGAAFASLITGSIGLVVAIAPEIWLGLFTDDADVLASGAGYLHLMGPTYVFLGLGLCLYFASQGAGRLLWPLVGAVVRLVVAVCGGWVAIHWLDAGLLGVFVASALAITLYGLVVGLSVYLSPWSDAPSTPSLRR